MYLETPNVSLGIQVRLQYVRMYYQLCFCCLTPSCTCAFQETPNVSSNTWDKLREAALDSGGVVAADEHVYKLAHVCHARALRNTDARMGDVYKRAVRTLVETDRFDAVGDA